MEDNEIVIQIYQQWPLRIHDGVPLLDIAAVGFLMDTFEVSQNERQSVLDRLQHYHSIVSEKKG